MLQTLLERFRGVSVHGSSGTCFSSEETGANGSGDSANDRQRLGLVRGLPVFGSSRRGGNAIRQATDIQSQLSAAAKNTYVKVRVVSADEGA